MSPKRSQVKASHCFFINVRFVMSRALPLHTLDYFRETKFGMLCKHLSHSKHNIIAVVVDWAGNLEAYGEVT